MHTQSWISEAASGSHASHLLFDKWKYCEAESAEHKKKQTNCNLQLKNTMITV